jgi:hypothetical protein
LKVAASDMVNLGWRCGRRGAVRGPGPGSGMSNPAIESEDLTGDPSRIRTCNPQSRNLVLYPVELWDRSFTAGGRHSTANMKNPLSGQALLRTLLRFRATYRNGGPLRLSALKAMWRHHRLPDDVQGLASSYVVRNSFAISFGGHEAVTFAFPIETRRLSASQGAPS